MYIIRRRLNKVHPRIHKCGKKCSDFLKLDGLYKMYSIRNGHKVQIDEKHNTIMNDVYKRVVRAFTIYSLAYHYQIRYLAIGDDTTPVTANDTALGNETYRTRYVVRNETSNGVLTTDFYITATEFNDDIEELGVFGGTFATVSTGTGNLLSHVLWSYTKENTEELLIEYQLTAQAA